VHSPVPTDVRVMAQASAAAEEGFEVDIVCTRRNGEAPLERLGERIQVVRLPVRHAHGSGLPTVVGEYLAFTSLALAKVGALHRRRRYDVVEVHNPPDFLMLAGLVPKLAGAKTIL